MPHERDALHDAEMSAPDAHARLRVRVVPRVLEGQREISHRW